MSQQDSTGQKIEFSLSGVLANEAQKKQLLGFIEEIVLWEQKIEEAKAGIKDIKGEAKDALDIPTTTLNELIRERLDNGSLDEKIKKLEGVKDLAIGLGITQE
jgi:hypothetical protein